MTVLAACTAASVLLFRRSMALSSKHLVLSGETGGQRIVKILLNHIGDFCKARAFQKAVDDLCIGFSGVQIPRRLHRQAQFFNIKICPVGRVDFPSRKSVETSNTFAMRSKCSVLILSVLPLTNRLMALSVLPMRVASCAWVILCSFISSCIRCRILPGR